MTEKNLRMFLSVSGLMLFGWLLAIGQLATGQPWHDWRSAEQKHEWGKSRLSEIAADKSPLVSKFVDAESVALYLLNIIVAADSQPAKSREFPRNANAFFMVEKLKSKLIANGCPSSKLVQWICGEFVCVSCQKWKSASLVAGPK